MSQPMTVNPDAASRTDGTDSEHSASNGTSKLLDRRDYLKLTSAAAVGGMASSAAVGRAAGSPSTSGGGPPGGDGTGIGDPGYSFSSTVDAVANAGMDPNGNDPINDKLNDALTSGTRLEFPPGTYLVDPPSDGRGMVWTDLSNVAMLGTGDKRDDVRFVLPSGKASRMFNFGQSCANIWLANFVFDQSTHSTSWIELNCTCSGDVYIYNIAHVGSPANEADSGPPGDPYEDQSGISFTMGPDATAHLENYANVSPPNRIIGYKGQYNNSQGLFAGDGNRGLVEVVNSHIAYKGEHAFYMSRSTGPIHIDGGYFHNNLNTNMRMAGPDDWARGATVHLDFDPSFQVAADTGKKKTARGLKWEDSETTPTGGLVEDCDFIVETEVKSAGIIQVLDTTSELTVRNCRLRHDANEPDCVVINGPTTFEDCSWTGSTTRPAVNANASTTIRNPCIDMPNSPGFVGDVNVSSKATSSCRVASPPKDDPPDDDPPGDQLPNKITIKGTAGRTDYSFSTTGELNPAKSAESNGKNDAINEGDGSKNDQVQGSIYKGYEDAYRFGGNIGFFDYSGGDIRVWVNDNEIDNPETYWDDDGDGGGGEELPNTLKIEGLSGNGRAEYTVTGTGKFTTDASDPNIVDGQMSGAIAEGGSDTVKYSGELTEFTANKEVRTIVNGEEVNQGTIGDGSGGGGGLPNTLKIEAPSGSGRVNYTVTGTGKFTTDASNPNIVSGEVSGTVAEGGSDTINYSGELTEFTANKEVCTIVNGEEVGQGTIGDGDGGGGGGLPNTIRIEGAGNGRVEYTIEGTGKFKGDFFGQAPQSGSVTGSINDGGVDTITYSGELTEFMAAEKVRTIVNGKEVNQGTIGDSDSGGDLPNTLKIEGLSGNGRANYTVTGTGKFTTDASDPNIVNGEVSGTVAEGGSDTINYSGELTEFTANKEVRTIVNGEEVNQGTI